MWPWRRRVEVVLASSAGDDATAALTMILRYHRRSVTVDEVRQAIYEGGTNVHAGQIIEAAEHFRLHGYGLGLEDPLLLERIPMPNIAHMMWNAGQFPRPLDEIRDGYFAVVASTSQDHISWINPYSGQTDQEPAEFFELASGVFLVFDKAHPLPRTTLRRIASDG